MTYVDGFVAAVSTANREIYKKHAEAAAVVFKEHGALKLVECLGGRRARRQGHRFPWGSSARTMRPWSSPGSSGLRARCVIKALRVGGSVEVQLLPRTECRTPPRDRLLRRGFALR